MRLVALAVYAVLAAAPTAWAQSLELPRLFIGGGASLATNDSEHRMRLGDQTMPAVFAVEAAARIAPRIAIGAEFMQPADSEGVTQGQGFQSFGEQRERAIIGTLRARLAGSGPVALDAVGGAGVLFQHHELRLSPCFSGCEVLVVETMTNRAPAFLAGADVPVRLGGHFGIAATGRIYFLNRGEHVTVDPRTELIPWQFEWQSSQRFALGITARAVW